MRFGSTSGPGLQVIDRAHAVPDLEPCRVAAEQNAADPEGGVRGCPVHLRQCGGHLASLALVDGVEYEGRHAVEGQQSPHGLIFVMGFRLGRMAARHDHAGKWRLMISAGGQEQQGGDVVLRLALEDHFLDPVAIAFDNACHSGIEGRLCGQAANRFEEFLPQVLLVSGDLFGRFQFFVSLPPLLELLPGLLPQVSSHHLTGGSAVNALRQDTQSSRLPEPRCSSSGSSLLSPRSCFA